MVKEEYLRLVVATAGSAAPFVVRALTAVVETSSSSSASSGLLVTVVASPVAGISVVVAPAALVIAAAVEPWIENTPVTYESQFHVRRSLCNTFGTV